MVGCLTILIVCLLGIGLFLFLLNRAQVEKRLQEFFSRQLLDVRERELKAISREIHDSAGQGLILLKQRALIKGDKQLAELAGSTLEDLRRLSHQIHPFILEKFGLTFALNQLVRLVDENSEIFVTSSIEPVDNLFSKENELRVYRMLQECLTNTMKHSNSQSVEVEITYANGNLKLIVADLGQGFNWRQAVARSTSFGLRTIQERLQILNGKLKVESEIGQGTTFTFDIPCQSYPDPTSGLE